MKNTVYFPLAFLLCFFVIISVVQLKANDNPIEPSLLENPNPEGNDPSNLDLLTKDWFFNWENTIEEDGGDGSLIEFKKGKIQLPFFNKSIDVLAAQNQNSNMSGDLTLFPDLKEQAVLQIWEGLFYLSPNSAFQLKERNINGKKTYIPFAEVTGDFELNLSNDLFHQKIKIEEEALFQEFAKALKIHRKNKIQISIPALRWRMDPFAPKNQQTQIIDYDSEQSFLKIGKKEYPIEGVVLLEGEEDKLALKIHSQKDQYLYSFTFWGEKNAEGEFVLETITTEFREEEKIKSANFPVNGDELIIEFLKLKLKLNGKKVAAGALSNYNFNNLNTETEGDIKVPNISNLNLDNNFLTQLQNHSNDVNLKIEAATSNTSTAFELPIDLTPHLTKFLGKYLESNATAKFPDNSKLILAGLELNSDNSEATATLLLTQEAHNQVFVFGNANVKIAADKVSFENLKLYTLNDYQVADSQLPFSVKKVLNNDPTKGSYAEISCDGFEGFNVQSIYEFYFQETEPDGLGCTTVEGTTQMLHLNETEDIQAARTAWMAGGCRPNMFKQLKLPFTIGEKSLTSFRAPVNIPEDFYPFLIRDFESVLFHINTAFVQFDYGEQPTWENACPEPNLFNNPTFKGIHFSKVDLQLLGFHEEKTSGREVLKIPMTDFVFQKGSGLYGAFEGNNIVPMAKNADVGGWPFSIDFLRFKVTANKVTTEMNTDSFSDGDIYSNGGLVFTGKMALPIVDETNEDNWMAYLGAIGFKTTEREPMVFLRIEETEQGKDFHLKFWDVLMSLGTSVETPTSTITLALNESADDFWFSSEYEPFADMSGVLKIDYDGVAPEPSGYFKEAGFKPTFRLPTLAFGNWKINNPDIMTSCNAANDSPYRGIRNMTIDYFSFGGWSDQTTGAIQMSSLAEDDDKDKDKDKDDDDDDDDDESLQGMPISIWDINFSCYSEGEDWGYKLDFEVHVDFLGLKNMVTKPLNTKFTNDDGMGLTDVGGKSIFDEGDDNDDGDGGSSIGLSELKAIGQIGIYSKYNEETKSMEFDKVLPEAFLVDADFNMFTIKGGFVMFSGDPVYGDGFKGAIEFSMDALRGLNMTTLMQVGKTTYDDGLGTSNPNNEYRYFFIDLDVVLENGFAIPTTPPLVYFHGGGGGFQWNMIAEDIAPGEGFDVTPGNERNYGETSHDSGILSEESDPDGLLLPGKSISSFTYKPRPGTLGFRAKTVWSINNSAEFMWADATLNMNFKYDEFQFLKANFEGNAYFYSKDTDGGKVEVGDTDHAAATANILAEYNHEKGFLQIIAGFEMDYEPAPGVEIGIEGEGHLLVLFKDVTDGIDLPIKEEGQWQLKIGVPPPGQSVGAEISISLGDVSFTFAEVSAYLQAGYNIDPLPRIADLIPEWDVGDPMKPRKVHEMEKNNAGKGFILGAHFKIPDNIYEFLMFRARLAAGAGFDLSMLYYEPEYAAQLGCAGEDGSFGINNWYARGQAYGYLKATLDVHINLLFYSAWINIFDAYAAASLQAELPNPWWMRAIIKARFSVLNGAIKGRVNFKAEIGERCESFANNPLAGMPVIQDMVPDQASNTNIPIYQQPAVIFNFPIEKSIVIEDYNSDDELVQRNFRPHLKSIKIYKGNSVSSSNQLNGLMKVSDDFYSGILELDDLLEKNTEYHLVAEASWEERKDGQWRPFKYQGKDYVETKSVTFTTGDRFWNIPKDALAYQAPGYHQRYWHDYYAVPQLLFANNNWGYLFPENTDQLITELQSDGESTDGIPTDTPLEYVVKLTEYDPNNGAVKRETEFPVGNHPGKVESYDAPEIRYKQPGAGNNLNIRLPYVETVTQTGKSVEFEKLNVQDLQKGHLYKLQIVRKISEAFTSIATSQQTSSANFSSQSSKDSDGNEDEEITTIERTVTQLEGGGAGAGQAHLNKVLYEYYFGVSKYDNLFAKLDAYSIELISDNKAKEKDKYDHPKDKFYEPLPIKNKYKDRYFGVKEGQEGIDKFDAIKLLKNLVIKSPVVTSPSEIDETYGYLKETAEVEGAHPWEDYLYVEADKEIDNYLVIKGGNSLLGSINQVDVDKVFEKEQLDENVRGNDKEKAIEPRGGTSKDLSDLKEHYKNEKSTRRVRYSTFQNKIGTASQTYIGWTDCKDGKCWDSDKWERDDHFSYPKKVWECNRLSDDLEWSNLSTNMNEDNWMDWMHYIMQPYYEDIELNVEIGGQNQDITTNGIKDWAFHLRFNEGKKTLSDTEIESRKIDYQPPSGSIDGLTGESHNYHFAFESSRERIIKNQYDLAKINVVYNYMSNWLEDWDECDAYSLWPVLNHYFNLPPPQSSGVSGTAFVEWDFPKLNRWRRFDESVSEETREATGNVKYKLPVSTNASQIPNVETEEGEINWEEIKIKGVGGSSQSTSSTNPFDLHLEYPDELIEVTKIVVFTGDWNKRIFYWDKDLNEDHYYAHNSNGHIEMQVDFSPKLKYSGVKITDGYGDYAIYLEVNGRPGYYGGRVQYEGAKAELIYEPNKSDFDNTVRLVDYPLIRINYHPEDQKFSLEKLGYHFPNSVESIVLDSRIQDEMNVGLGGMRYFNLNTTSGNNFNLYSYLDGLPISNNPTSSQWGGRFDISNIEIGEEFGFHLKNERGKLERTIVKDFWKDQKWTVLLETEYDQIAEICEFDLPDTQKPNYQFLFSKTQGVIEPDIAYTQNTFSIEAKLRLFYLNSGEDIRLYEDPSVQVMINTDRSISVKDAANTELLRTDAQIMELDGDYHLAIVFDGNQMSLYLNGGLLKSENITNFELLKTEQTDQKTFIGDRGENRWKDEFSLDYFNIWSIPLSDCQIRENLANNSRPSHPNYLFHIDFNKGPGHRDYSYGNYNLRMESHNYYCDYWGTDNDEKMGEGESVFTPDPNKNYALNFESDNLEGIRISDLELDGDAFTIDTEILLSKELEDKIIIAERNGTVFPWELSLTKNHLVFLNDGIELRGQIPFEIVPLLWLRITVSYDGEKMYLFMDTNLLASAEMERPVLSKFTFRGNAAVSHLAILERPVFFCSATDHFINIYDSEFKDLRLDDQFDDPFTEEDSDLALFYTWKDFSETQDGQDSEEGTLKIQDVSYKYRPENNQGARDDGEILAKELYCLRDLWVDGASDKYTRNTVFDLKSAVKREKNIANDLSQDYYSINLEHGSLDGIAINGIEVTNTFTIETVLQFTRPITDRLVIMERLDLPWKLMLERNKVIFQNGDELIEGSLLNDIQSNQWNRINFSYSAGEVFIFLNGELVLSMESDWIPIDEFIFRGNAIVNHFMVYQSPKLFCETDDYQMHVGYSDNENQILRYNFNGPEDYTSFENTYIVKNAYGSNNIDYSSSNISGLILLKDGIICIPELLEFLSQKSITSSNELLSNPFEDSGKIFQVDLNTDNEFEISEPEYCGPVDSYKLVGITIKDKENRIVCQKSLYPINGVTFDNLYEYEYDADGNFIESIKYNLGSNLLIEPCDLEKDVEYKFEFIYSDASKPDLYYHRYYINDLVTLNNSINHIIGENKSSSSFRGIGIKNYPHVTFNYDQNDNEFYFTSNTGIGSGSAMFHGDLGFQAFLQGAWIFSESGDLLAYSVYDQWKYFDSEEEIDGQKEFFDRFKLDGLSPYTNGKIYLKFPDRLFSFDLDDSFWENGEKAYFFKDQNLANDANECSFDERSSSKNMGLNFNGKSDSFLKTSLIQANGDKFSLCTKIKFNSLGNNTIQLFNQPFQFSVSKTELRFNNLSESYNLEENKWYTLLLTYGDEKIKCFIDGELVFDRSIYFNLPSSFQLEAFKGFNGIVDQLFFLKDNSLCNLIKGRQIINDEDLVFYYDFDDPVFFGKIKDISNNSFDAEFLNYDNSNCTQIESYGTISSFERNHYGQCNVSCPPENPNYLIQILPGCRDNCYLWYPSGYRDVTKILVKDKSGVVTFFYNKQSQEVHQLEVISEAGIKSTSLNITKREESFSSGTLIPFIFDDSIFPDRECSIYVEFDESIYYTSGPIHYNSTSDYQEREMIKLDQQPEAFNDYNPARLIVDYDSNEQNYALSIDGALGDLQILGLRFEGIDKKQEHAYFKEFEGNEFNFTPFIYNQSPQSETLEWEERFDVSTQVDLNTSEGEGYWVQVKTNKGYTQAKLEFDDIINGGKPQTIIYLINFSDHTSYTKDFLIPESDQNYAMKLDNEPILANSIISTGTDFTITCWLKKEDAESQSTIVGTYDGIGRIESNSFYAHEEGGLGYNLFRSQFFTIEEDKWFHIAFSLKGRDLHFYVNGELISQSQHNRTRLLDYEMYGNLFIGENFKGEIEALNIWDIALNQEEIIQAMELQEVSTENLLVGYSFNEPLGTNEIRNDGSLGEPALKPENGERVPFNISSVLAEAQEYNEQKNSEKDNKKFPGDNFDPIYFSNDNPSPILCKFDEVNDKFPRIFELWIKHNESNNEQVFLSFYSSIYGPEYRYEISITENKDLKFSLEEDNITLGITLDKYWHHLMIEFPSVYLDGEYIGSLYGMPYMGKIDKLIIGHEGFDGWIDELRFWDVNGYPDPNDYLVNMNNSISNPEEEEYLYAYYNLNEGTNSYKYKDSSQKHSDCTCDANKPLNYGNFALDFDGEDDHVKTEEIDLSGSEITLETWFKLDALQNEGDPTGYSYLAGVFEVPNAAHLRIHKDGRIIFRLEGQGNNPKELNLPNLIELDNQWHHVAGVFDGSTMKIYLDGLEVGSMPFSGTFNANGSFYIGKSVYGGPFDGQIDEVMVWKEARTPDQIQSDMSTGPGENTTNLALYYDFNGAIGDTKLIDGGSEEKDGDLLNMNPSEDWIVSNKPMSSQEESDSESQDIEAPEPGFQISLDGHDEFLFQVNEPGDPPCYLCLGVDHIEIPGYYLPNQENKGCYVYVEATNGMKVNGRLPYTIGPRKLLYGDENSYEWINYPSWENGNMPDNAIKTYVQQSQKDHYICRALINGEYRAGSAFAGDNKCYISEKTNYGLAENPYEIDWSDAQLLVEKSNQEQSDNSQEENTPINYVLDFDGNDDYIDCQSVDLSGSSLTMETWFKLDAFQTNHPYIATLMGIEKDDNIALLRIGDANAQKKLQFVLKLGIFDRKITSTNELVIDNEWHHVAGVYDGSTMKLYLDGVEIESGSFNGVLQANGPFYLSRSAGGRHLDGQMDEVMVWKEARTAAQIQSDMSNGPGTITNNLYLYYDFNEQIGSNTLSDSGTANKNGSLQQMDNNSVWVASDKPNNQQSGSQGGQNNNDTGSNVTITATISSNKTEVEQGGLAELNFEIQGGQAPYTVTYSDGTNDKELSDWESGFTDEIICNETKTYTLVSIKDANNIEATDLNGNPTIEVIPLEINYALDFDGNNDYVNCQSVDLSGSSITMETWFKLDAFQTNHPYIATLMGIEEGNNVALLRIGDVGNERRLQFVVKVNTGFSQITEHKITAPNELTLDGDWHHVAGVYDGSTMKLYLDGVEIVSEAKSGSLQANGSFYLSRSAGGRHLDGQMDEVMVWKEARTAAQIQSDMSSGPSTNTNNLYLYYDFNEQIGSNTLSDSGTANKNGSLQQMDNNSVWVTSDKPNNQQSGNQSDQNNNDTGSNVTITATISSNKTEVEQGGLAELNFEIQGGQAPYTVTYSDGSNNVELPDWHSGDPMEINCNETKTYTLVSVKDANNIEATELNGNPTIEVIPLVVNYALDFDGNDDFINCQSIDLNGSSITMETWFKLDAFQTNHPYIATLMGIEEGDNVALLRIGDVGNERKLQFVVKVNAGFFGTTEHKITAPNELTLDNEWHHVAGVYDGSTMKLYLDGVEIVSEAKSGSLSANNTFYISRSAGSRHLDGQMDEVMVWKEARTSAQIQSDMSNGPGTNTNNLLLYYDFNEEEGSSTITDKGSANKNGNLQNMDTNSDWVSSDKPSGN